jgi:hypothetical protein
MQKILLYFVAVIVIFSLVYLMISAFERNNKRIAGASISKGIDILALPEKLSLLIFARTCNYLGDSKIVPEAIL